MSAYRLETFNPKERREQRRHIEDGDSEFVLRCWSCRRDFTVWIGLENMNQSLFDCPHCNETNEIE
jgi:DNA-directed RNA polymerase subunit RPC12/RpoP